ncbi:hypothetical protein J0H58_11590 [bacterium]|nr:hypothetical protein [bacterium]
MTWLALVGTLVAGYAATTASPPAAVAAVVPGVGPVPPIDIPFLLNQFTVRLGTVPVID